MEFDAVAVRVCGVEDAAALALVGAATFLETYAGMVEGAAIIAHCARQHGVAAYETYLREPRSMAWLAETREGAAPVGYALVTEPDLPLDDLGPEDLELKRIYLLSRLHGTGTGLRLLEASVAAVREAGCRRLLLGVNRENVRGLAFYRRNGFVEAGVRRFTVGHQTFDDLVLALRL